MKLIFVKLGLAVFVVLCAGNRIYAGGAKSGLALAAAEAESVSKICSFEDLRATGGDIQKLLTNEELGDEVSAANENTFVLKEEVSTVVVKPVLPSKKPAIPSQDKQEHPQRTSDKGTITELAEAVAIGVVLGVTGLGALSVLWGIIVGVLVGVFVWICPGDDSGDLP